MTALNSRIKHSVAARHYLKDTFNLSDEDVVEAWEENPYRKHFSEN